MAVGWLASAAMPAKLAAPIAAAYVESAVPDSFVQTARSGAVLTLTMNRPAERNAIGTLEDCEQLAASFDLAQRDTTIRCILLTGAGSAFCAGGNLRALKERTPGGIGPQPVPADTRSNYRRGVQRVIRAIWDCEVPAIAAVNGPAVGLGCDLAALCDIRIASESARFASTFVSLGIIPGDGGAWILPRAVGLSKASEMIFTGEMLDAAQALASGLVSRVVAPERLLAEAGELAQRIAAQPATALRLAKRLLREGQQQRLTDVLELSVAYQALAHETADHREAVEAFVEKRAPRFGGP